MHLTVILHKTASHHISLNESSIISTPSLKCNNDTLCLAGCSDWSLYPNNVDKVGGKEKHHHYYCVTCVLYICNGSLTSNIDYMIYI